MAVKYVKDFAFDSGFGFTGSKGATPVRAYMRGGAVKKSMNEGSKKAGPRAPALAPAMVEQRSKGLGGLTPETKKLASYDKPHMEGKKGAKVPQYAKGGAVKKHVKKPMAKMMKKAEGGPVAEITEGDGMSPLQAMALPEAPMYDAPMGMRGREFEPVDFDPGNRNRDFLRRMQEVPSLPPMDTNPADMSEAQRSAFLLQMLDRDTQRMRGDAAQQMRDLSALEEAPPVPLAGERYPIGTPMPVGALTPLPEEPQYDIPPELREPPKRIPASRAMQQPPMLEQLITKEMQPGYIRPRADDIPPVPVAPPRPTGMLPSPLAAAARMAPQDRRAMRADRNEMARDIMDRYIAGPRRAMPAARRAMPVAPSEPMIQIPRAPRGGVMTYAKGGKVGKGEQKIGKVMGEFKRGELHSGSKQGPLVTNPKQAKAIALSEARAAGAKIPKKAMGGKACG